MNWNCQKVVTTVPLYSFYLSLFLLMFLAQCFAENVERKKLPKDLFEKVPVVDDVKKIQEGCFIIRSLKVRRVISGEGRVRYYIPKRVRRSDGKINPPPEEDMKRLCLLDTCPQNAGKGASPMVTLERDKKVVVRPFDIIRVFENRGEAEEFARKNFIKDVLLEE